MEPQDLPAKQAELEAALETLEAAADIAALEAARAQHENQYRAAADQLSAWRRQNAARLSAETGEHMQDLAMKGAHSTSSFCPAPRRPRP